MKSNKSCRIGVVIFILLSIFSWNLYTKENNIIPSVIEFKRSNMENVSDITFKELYSLKSYFHNYKITGYSEKRMSISTDSHNEKKMSVSTNNQSNEIISVLTDGNYFKINQNNILYVIGIDEDAISNGSKVAVISDELARELFLTTNCVGNSIKLDDRIFKIIGIYEKEKTFLYSISEDSYERVIIPYKSIENYDKEQLDEISIVTDEDETTVIKKIDSIINNKISNYDVINYVQEKEIGYQYVKIVYFIIFLVLSILIFGIIFSNINRVRICIKSEMKNNYFMDIIKKSKNKFIKKMIKIMVLLGCILIMYNLFEFTIIVKREYILNENIFDFQYYSKIFIRDCNEINNVSRFTSTYERYVNNINNILFINSFILFITFLKVIFSYKKRLFKKYKKGNI